ncbi:MAG: DUF2059 domain-containing protein [Acidobacteriota bacterium]|nr:DUF2059 domain-containing protein [Acidobacteriota bacterium]
MKLRIWVIAAALCIGGSALAQAPAPNLPQAPAAHRQSETSTPPAKAPAATPASPAATLDPAKEAAIRHLMDITQSSKLGDNMAEYISGQVRRYMSQSMDPNTLPKFMDTFNQRFAVSAPSKNVTDAMVPVYDRAFSKDEIDGLVRFYESPLGQHVVKVLPQVLEESQNAAEKMDQDAALNVLRDMSAEYPQLKNILPGPSQQQPAQQEGGAPQPQKQTAPVPAPQK